MPEQTRLFVIKHPCDDLPTIMHVLPDPRSGDARFSFDGPDYSGFYTKEPRLLTWWRNRKRP